MYSITFQPCYLFTTSEAQHTAPPRHSIFLLHGHPLFAVTRQQYSCSLGPGTTTSTRVGGRDEDEVMLGLGEASYDG